jgi:hypothetical protein
MKGMAEGKWEVGGGRKEEATNQIKRSRHLLQSVKRSDAMKTGGV